MHSAAWFEKRGSHSSDWLLQIEDAAVRGLSCRIANNVINGHSPVRLERKHFCLFLQHSYEEAPCVSVVGQDAHATLQG